MGAGLRERQHVSNADPMPRFQATLGVDAQSAVLDEFSSKIARFEEPGKNPPFVQPQFRLDRWVRFGRRPSQSQLGF